MQMRVGATQLSLAVEMDTKIDQITKMMERLAAGAHTDPAEMDPNVLAEIAKQAGMEAGSNNANPWGNSRVMRLLRGRGLGVCVHS